MRLAFALLPLLAVFSRAAESPEAALDRAEAAVTGRIDTAVLNPILGVGKGFAFVKLSLVVKTEDDVSGRNGEGRMTRALSTSGVWSSTSPSPGFEVEASTSSKGGNGERTQESRQTVGRASDRLSVSREYADFKIVILHDKNVPSKNLDGVKRALLAIYAPGLKSDAIRFQSAEFASSNP